MINGKCGDLGVIKCYILIPSFAFMRRPRLGAVTAVNCSRRFMHAFLVETAPSKLAKSSNVSALLSVFFSFSFFFLGCCRRELSANDRCPIAVVGLLKIQTTPARKNCAADRVRAEDILSLKKLGRAKSTVLDYNSH